jgi:hypothetical protein
MGKRDGAGLVVAVEIHGGPHLVEERQPGEQIVHEGLGAVGVIGITPSASAQASEVNGIAGVDALVWVVAVEESQERFAGLRVDV